MLDSDLAALEDRGRDDGGDDAVGKTAEELRAAHVFFIEEDADWYFEELVGVKVGARKPNVAPHFGCFAGNHVMLKYNWIRQ